jgi:hypothetical protein
MRSEGPALFYLPEPKFGCSQPVRKGDLLRVKATGHGWKYEGLPFLVLGITKHLKYSEEHELTPDAAIGIIDGKQEVIVFEYLEILDDEESL